MKFDHFILDLKISPSGQVLDLLLHQMIFNLKAIMSLLGPSTSRHLRKPHTLMLLQSPSTYRPKNLYNTKQVIKTNSISHDENKMCLYPQQKKCVNFGLASISDFK